LEAIQHCVVESTKMLSSKDNIALLSKHIEETFTERVLDDIDEEDSGMKRLSILENEIEQFEREFVIPMKKSVSSLNIREK
jgi:hypothetical protein